MNLSVPILSVLIGVVVLFFGRKLFWLCVAAVGFAAGMQVAPHLMHEPSEVLQLSLAIVFGFIGALLALFLQKVAIAIAGFLAGGKLATALVAAFVAEGARYPGIAFIVGGIIGAILLLALFDWALIVMSALVGAYLIKETVPLPHTGSILLFVGLVAVGIIVQAAAFRRRTVA
ncbi:MAG TPA: DUF4203 domain-containing protein [Chthoniobacterales bacterium]|jgi:Domain of unknown function (DUF4203)|nr:DUF4203 domain-containing protein [Chthoniobacterales bacterium]